MSTATASRALNGKRSVDPALVRRVKRAVAELGYVHNKLASALVNGRSKILGLIVPEITDPFFPEVVQAFENTAMNLGYEILVTSTLRDLERIAASVRRMVERRVDGIAVLTFGIEELLPEHLRYSNVPLAFVDPAPSILGAIGIRVDYMRGIRQAVQHLAALRHESIVFISGPPHLRSAAARKAAFETAVTELGRQLSNDTILAGDHTIESGARALRALLKLPNRPTAIICSNDVSAIGVIREAYRRISIPSELSLVGFDDNPLSGLTTPALTTVRMSQSELARLACRALVDSLEDKIAKKRRNEYSLTTELVLRESTALSPFGSRV